MLFIGFKIDHMLSTLHSSGVPGELRGLQHLHSKYGVLEWKDNLQGAIQTARNGWNVTKDLVKYMASANASAQVPNFLCVEPAWYGNPRCFNMVATLTDW